MTCTPTLAPHSIHRTPGAVPPSMTTPLMPLHITPDAKSLTTSLVRAQERLLARVAVAVDLGGS